MSAMRNFLKEKKFSITRKDLIGQAERGCCAQNPLNWPHTFNGKYTVPKGYVTLDGASLTVCDVDKTSFSVMLIEYTQKHICLPTNPIGSCVNLEVGMIGKYVERYVSVVVSVVDNLYLLSQLSIP